MKNVKEELRKKWQELIPQENLFQRIAKKTDSNMKLIENLYGVESKNSKESVKDRRNANGEDSNSSMQGNGDVFDLIDGLCDSKNRYTEQCKVNVNLDCDDDDDRKLDKRLSDLMNHNNFDENDSQSLNSKSQSTKKNEDTKISTRKITKVSGIKKSSEKSNNIE